MRGGRSDKGVSERERERERAEGGRGRGGKEGGGRGLIYYLEGLRLKLTESTDSSRMPSLGNAMGIA